MKKIYAFSFALSLALGAIGANKIDEARFYLNPGHGSWGPNDRPMATIPYPNLATTGRPDTCGFYESNTNLWKALKLGATLEKYGAKHSNIIYSRVKTGPYPYVKGAEDEDLYNRPLSEICEEVCANNIDMFFSIHSNAASEGSNTNYPLFIYRGTDGKDGERVAGSYDMSTDMWPILYSNKIDVMSYYSPTSPNIRGDVSFYGSDSGRTDSGTGETYYGYLGALKHNAPGLLSEGYFHTYQPARHRALNHDYCGQEGVRYARGIAKYFGAPDETTGYIMGTVKDKHEKMVNSLYNYAAGSDDQWTPINGATVKLYKDGKEIASYTVDNNYNGVFVFENLQPGNYTIKASASDYKDMEAEYSEPFEVKANETSYPKIYLESNDYVAPSIIYTDYTEPEQDDNIGVPSTLEMKQKFADKAISKLEGMTVRRSILRNDTLTVLAFGENNKPYIYQFNPTTQKFIREISTEGVPEIDTTNGGVFTISDIAFTADNKLVACNKCKTQFSDDQVDEGDIRGTFRCFIWNDLDADPSELLTSKLSGNYYRAWTGNTIAVSGSSDDLTLLTTTVTTGSAAGMRLLQFNVIDGKLSSSLYMKSSFSENTLGTDNKLYVSPRDEKQFVINGSGTTPIEFRTAASATEVSVLGQLDSSLVNAKATGATFFKYAKHSLMTSPVTDADGKNNGVALFDVTDGLSNAKLINTTNTAIEASESANMMAAGVVNNADITLYCMRNGNVSEITSDSVAQPIIKGIMAYDLRVKTDGDNYVFTYKSNSKALKSVINFTDNTTGDKFASLDIPTAVEGENTFTLAKSELPHVANMKWSIELTGESNGRVSKLSNSGIGAYGQGCVAVNNSTESDKFGYVYVGSAAKSGIVNPGLYEYNNDLVQTNYISSTEGSSRRLSLDSKGNVYVAHWSDGFSGVYRYDVNDLTQNWNIFNHNSESTKASNGLWSLNDVNLGGSSTCAYILGSGKDTKLYTYDEDYKVDGNGNNVLVYNLGEATEINEAPEKEFGGKVHSLTPNTDVQVIASTHGGFWTSQTRYADNNTASVPSLVYFDKEGNVSFNSGESVADVLNGSVSSGFAVNGDESLLAISDASNHIVLFDLTWDNDVPTLSYKYKFDSNDGFTGGKGIYQIAFDRANNVYISGSTLGVYTLLTENNICDTPAKSSLTLSGNEAKAPLELHATDNGDKAVSVTWTAPSADVVEYNLYLDDSKVARTTETSYTFTDVDGGNHQFGVSAVYSLNAESPISTVTIETSSVATIGNTAKLTISPNPTSGLINIQCEEEIAKVEVFSMNGTKVAESTESTLNLDDLASGIYLVKVNNLKPIQIIKK